MSFVEDFVDLFFEFCLSFCELLVFCVLVFIEILILFSIIVVFGKMWCDGLNISMECFVFFLVRLIVVIG